MARLSNGIKLPLGPPYGGLLFFSHYSFLGLDPRGLYDHYADFWEQNRAHMLKTVRIVWPTRTQRRLLPEQ